ncbi:MAG: hypothetical protein ABJG78_19695 [Cyclobacteriaceae bacterium]
MNELKVALFLFSSLLSTFGTLAQASEEQEVQNALVGNYLEALKSTMHGKSSAEDILLLTELYATNVIYEHPGIGIKLETKEVISKGLLSFLGSYGGEKEGTQIKILNQIFGKGRSTVEFEIKFRTSDGKSISRKQVQVLEFKDQQIRRIIDYW